MKLLSFGLVFLGVLGCSSPAAPRADDVQVTGTVRYVPLEGGLFAIRGDDGVTYEPTNLMACYKRDGLRVQATLRIRRELGSIYMVGPVAEIQTIYAPDAGPCALPG